MRLAYAQLYYARDGGTDWNFPYGVPTTLDVMLAQDQDQRFRD